MVFSGAALLLLVVPGPAVLYIVTRGATQGRRAGLVSVAGIHVGTLVHIAFALVGLSAILVASSQAFTTVRLAGAAYLVLLGIQALRRPTGPDGPVPQSGGARSLHRVFVDGVVLNILNPKTALFFLAFVPQFVDVGAGHPTSQLLVLGAVFILLGVISDGAYAISAGLVGRRLATSPSFARRKDLIAGVAFVALGGATALAGRPATSQ